VGRDIAKISILCSPSQRQGVWVALALEDLRVYDGDDYTMGCTLEGYTMDDKKASDTWDLHPMLRTREAEGVPPFAPFGHIITAASRKPPDYTCPPNEVKDRRAKENPCPLHTERTKYSFAMNLSKHWQEDIDAPMCQEYPYSFAIANYLWWHLQKGSLLVTLGKDAMLPLVGCYMGMDVIALDENIPDSTKNLSNALHSMKYMANEQQLGYTTHHAHCLTPPASFMCAVPTLLHI
jgi:hypothetical protein